jgi:MFS family permease
VNNQPHEAAAEPRVPKHPGSFLTPFRFRDFRLLWTGMFIGNFGVWMQFTALGYYVAKLAPNAAIGSFYIGLLGASRMVPVLFVSPIAGAMADRYPRRSILLSTNVVTALIALAFSLVLWQNVATLWVVLLLSALQAATQAFDAPARQSWVALLVPRENMANAIGLNALGMNVPSVLGPPVAGLLITFIGISWCMGINAILKLWVVFNVAQMRSKDPGASARKASMGSAIGEGVQFLYRHPVLKWVFLVLLISAVTVRSYNFLLPAYAVHVINTDANGLGIMMAAVGIGSIIGALAVAMIQNRRRSRYWIISALLSSLGVSALGFVHGLSVSSIVLVFVGIGMQMFMGVSNVLIQTLSPEEMRGRAIGMYSMILMGFVPGGALLIGTLATVIDLREVLSASGLLCAAVALWAYITQKRVRTV